MNASTDENPAMFVPDAMQALHGAGQVPEKGGRAGETLELVHLRASQINGCGVCVDMHARDAQEGRRDRRAALRGGGLAGGPYFSDAERAALALTEAVTRLSDRADPVPDESGTRPARHYDEPALAALIIHRHDQRVESPQRHHQQVAGAWSTREQSHHRAAPARRREESEVGSREERRPEP